MIRKRKLEVDPDRESFSPFECISQLEDTPENLTFESARSRVQSERQMVRNKPARKHFRVSYGQEPSDFTSKIIRSETSNQKIDSFPQNRRSSRRSIIGGSLSNNHLSPEREKTINNQIDLIQKTVQQRHNQTKHIFEKNNLLESIIKAQKIKNLQSNFIKKISRTSTVVEPVQYQLVQGSNHESFLNSSGINIDPLLDNLLNVLSVLQIISLLVIYSISISFEDLISQNRSLSFLQLASLFFYLLEIILNLISIKSQSGKQITIIKEIIAYYAQRSFLVDIISLIILLVDILTSLAGISYLRLFIFFKLPGCLNKIQKLEVYFIRNIYNEQYWQVAKVFLVNFCIAHIIALFLAGMTRYNSQDNWMVIKGIANSNWFQQYIWSYYWATNIMLTVGFGDIVPTSSFEAICLIFIETFSCIVMAYNINCMGGIITNIRSENDKRSKKFKIFKKLSNQNSVPQELEFKINNYIEQSSNLKKKFNYEEDKQFLSELPEALKVSYLRQANKTVLSQLVFFRDLLDRTLYNFAEHLETVVCHPQEIIRNLDDDYNLMILKKGQIGYICKKNGCSLNDKIVDLIKVDNNQAPFLTSLDFLSKKRPPYQIKSLKFSVIFKLDYNKFIDTFKQSNMDYELFCFIRDKIRNIPDEFQVLPCTFCQCKFNHFKFTCPKLHYAPFQQHIIDKQLYKQKIGKNRRTKFQRTRKVMIPPVQYFRKLKNYQDVMKRSFKKTTATNLFQAGKIKEQFLNRPLISSAGSSILQPSQKFIKEISYKDLQSILVIKTKQMLQMQFLRREKKQNYEDEIWLLNLDLLTDYNSYFSQNNPNLLKDNFNPQQRIHKKLDRINNYQKINILRVAKDSCIQDRQSLDKISSIVSQSF